MAATRSATSTVSRAPAIVHDSGGRSQVASLTAVALMIALALLASHAMAYVPRAALAGILVYIAIKIFRVGEMINIARRGGREILLVVASAALVVVLPIESGMLLAIVLSFVHSLYIVARPYCAELARVPGTTVWWPPMPHDHIEHEPGVLRAVLHRDGVKRRHRLIRRGRAG